MKPSAEKKERGAKGTKRRALCFWSPLNSWLRSYQEENGKRPRPDQVQCWYDKHAADVWGDDKPSWTETRDHAKCVKPQAQIRSYFRKYRARQQAKKMLTAAQTSPSTATTTNSTAMVPATAYGMPMDTPALMPGYGATAPVGTASPPALRGPHCGQPLMQHAAQQQHSMMPGCHSESMMQAAQACGVPMTLKSSPKSSPFAPHLPAHQLELERIGSDLSSDSGFSHLSCASRCDSISNGGTRNAARRGGAYMARMVPAAGCAEPMPAAAQPRALHQNSPACRLASSGEDSPAATWMTADLAWSQHGGNVGVLQGCHAQQQHATAQRDAYASYARPAAQPPGLPAAAQPRVQSVFGTASNVAAAAGGKLCIDPLMETSVDPPRTVFDDVCGAPSRPPSALPGMQSLMGMCSQPHAASLLQTPTCSLMSSLLVNPACAEDANDGCMTEPFNSACFDDQLITNLGTPGFVL